MGDHIELVHDGDGLAVIGNSSDIERFFLSAGLDQARSRELDLHRLSSFSGAGATAAGLGAYVAENSGRWVKLTPGSAKAIREFGLMPTNPPGVSHAMIGQRGHIKQWVQIAHAPSALLAGPFAVTALSTMMQQRAMQQQMNEIVEYLQVINEKVDDILRGQKDAVLSDMIGIDLIIEEAMTVRDEVGRVSDVTWSKVQATDATIGRTQGFALRQLDHIAEKLRAKADVGDIAKVTKEAESKVREWLAVLARTFQLKDALMILELDRVLDGAPEDLNDHRRGLIAARQKRVEVIDRSTAALLSQMDETVRRANSRVLFNPFDSPAAVKSSNRVAIRVLDFRAKLSIDSGHESTEAKRWRQAAAETRDKVLTSASKGVNDAGRLGADTLGRATDVFRAVDVDGDGIPDKPRVAAAAEEAGAAIKDAANGVTGGFRTLFQRRSKHDRDESEHPER